MRTAVAAFVFLAACPTAGAGEHGGDSAAAVRALRQLLRRKDVRSALERGQTITLAVQEPTEAEVTRAKLQAAGAGGPAWAFVGTRHTLEVDRGALGRARLVMRAQPVWVAPPLRRGSDEWRFRSTEPRVEPVALRRSRRAELQVATTWPDLTPARIAAAVPGP